jgi:hypothetical protein
VTPVTQQIFSGNRKSEMSWAACCSNKQMQDMFFGESSSMMFRDAAKGRREAPCQWCFEQVQMFVVGKSLIWVCDNCKGISEACEKCGTPVRQQTIRKDNYKTCSMCFKKDFKVGFVFDICLEFPLRR